ncbi:MAG: hypothetical protein WBG34_06800, partial [Flavobacteriales bacterium]
MITQSVVFAPGIRTVGPARHGTMTKSDMSGVRSPEAAVSLFRLAGCQKHEGPSLPIYIGTERPFG